MALNQFDGQTEVTILQTFQPWCKFLHRLVDHCEVCGVTPLWLRFGEDRSLFWNRSYRTWENYENRGEYQNDRVDEETV
jgi:hypothetical protein